jgi:biopolymer transport protein ExbD
MSEERKYMRLLDEPDLPPQINIVPMIDIVFAILTFFIVSTLSLTRSQGLPVNLPKAATAKSQSPTKIVVTINQQGQLSLNRKPIQLGQLADQVKSLITSHPQSIVVINADQQVAHGQVVTVMDQVRKIEGAKLAIAAQRP